VSVKRASKLGFVVSLHLALFATAAAAGGSVLGALGFGAASAVGLAVALFYTDSRRKPTTSVVG
jgi:hypothetical protein